MSRLSELGEKFFAQGIVEDCPIYDVHGHMGPHYGIYMPITDAEGTVRCMDKAGVAMLVFSHHAALMSTIGNPASIEEARKFPDRLKVYCAVNPNYPEVTEKDIETYDEYSDVYVGLKFLSDYHKKRLTDEGYRPALEFAESRSLPILFHTWGDSSFNGYDAVKDVAEKYPNARFLLGHSLHGDWDHAIELARDFPNVYLELTAVMDGDVGMLARFVENVGSEKILYGTDFPWFDFHYNIGAILGSEITDDDRRNIFYRNAKRILNL